MKIYVRRHLQDFLIVVLMLALIGPTAAQEQGMTEAMELANAPIVLEFSSGAAGPPSIEPVADGRIVLKIDAAGSVSGALEGTLSATVTEVNPQQSPILQGVGIMFSIETDQGSLMGYYRGSIYHATPDAEVADVHGYGHILSVSGAYADLFLADVYVTSQVQFVNGQGVSDSGTMTISPR